MTAQTDPATAPHELFLPEDDTPPDEPPLTAAQISGISVERIAPWKENAGCVFAAHELRTPNDLFTRWGGGHYIVRARDSLGRVTKKRGIMLAGQPKPMNVASFQQADDFQGSTPAQAAAPPPAPAPAIDLAPIATMVTASMRESRETMMAVINLLASQVTNLMQRGNQPTDALQIFKDGIDHGTAAAEAAAELANEALAAKPEKSAEEEVQDTLKLVVGGVEAFQKLQKPKK